MGNDEFELVTSDKKFTYSLTFKILVKFMIIIKKTVKLYYAILKNKNKWPLIIVQDCLTKLCL